MSTTRTNAALLPSLLLLLLLSCSSPFLTSAQPALDYTQLSIASISSNTCQDVYPYAWNCSLPSILSFTLSPTSFTLPSQLYFIIDGSDAETYTYATRSSPANATATTYRGTVQLGGYALGLMGRPLSVRVFDYVTGNTSSQAFVGMSFALLPPPTLTSISGCQGSGAATYLCLPDNDTVVLTGSGFSIFLGIRSYILLVGARSLQLGAVTGSANRVLQVVNDSYAYLNLSTVYDVLLTEAQYGGAVQSIAFNLPWTQLTTGGTANYYINALSISFVPLPPPQAMVDSSTACTLLTPSTLVNCTPGANAGVIRLVGDYMVSPIVTLSTPGIAGVWYGTTTVNNAVRVWFVLPIIAADKEGVVWDVTVSTSAGSIIFPGLVRYSTEPYVALINECVSTGSTSTTILIPNCVPGSTLTLSGDHFVDDPQLQVQVSSSSAMGGSTNISCLQPTFISSTSISCVVPLVTGSVAQLFYGQTVVLRVLFPSSGQASNGYSSRLMAWANSPVLTSVSGCEGNNGSSLVLQRCRGGDVVTVQGSNLRFYNAQRVTPNTIVGEWVAIGGIGSCTVLPGSSNSTVQCRLPYVDATNSLAQADLQYRVNWYGSTDGFGGLLFGNPFVVSFTWEPRAAPSPPTSSTTGMAVLIGVLVPVLLVVVAASAWLAWRRRECRECVKEELCPRSSTSSSSSTATTSSSSSSSSSSSGRSWSSWLARRPNLAEQHDGGGVELE